MTSFQDEDFDRTSIKWEPMPSEVTITIATTGTYLVKVGQAEPEIKHYEAGEVIVVPWPILVARVD